MHVCASKMSLQQSDKVDSDESVVSVRLKFCFQLRKPLTVILREHSVRERFGLSFICLDCFCVIFDWWYASTGQQKPLSSARVLHAHAPPLGWFVSFEPSSTFAATPNDTRKLSISAKTVHLLPKKNFDLMFFHN